MNQRTYKKKILEKAKNIRLIAMDVDGVLTNGDIIIRDSGEEVKTWNVRDRIAFYFARKILPDIKFAWVTGRGSKQVDQQAQEIGIDALYKNCMDKVEAFGDIKIKFSLTDREIAFVGDDLIDLPVLRRAGLSLCPLDAAPEVKDYVDVVSLYGGGKGVLREAVELVLTAQGLWQTLISAYVKT